MHHFKRYYLLGSLILSFLIPFIEVPSEIIPEVYQEQENQIIADPIYSNFEIIPATIEEEESSNLFSILLLIYGSVFGVLIIRFLRNLFGPVSLLKQAEKYYDGRKSLILCNQEINPFCFLNWIFVNKTAYQTNKIEAEILTHEFAHATQKHSVDVILVELLITVCWFNPFLYLYRKAIRLNHEFLADEAVLKQFEDPLSYQKLMLSKLAPDINFAFSNSFNFLTTKKRLVMMTVSTSTVNRLLKQLSLLPILTLIVFLFGEKTMAQLKEEWEEPKIFKTEVMEQDIVEEFLAILSKYQKNNPDWKKNLPKVISEKDEKYIEGLYLKMDKTQKERLPVVFLDVFTEKKVPSPEQMESFKDEKKYGVWIDGVQVKNNKLNKYSNTDFSHFGISRLTRTAKNYGIHVYQLNLMTNTYWDKKEKEGSIGYRLLFVKI